MTSREDGCLLGRAFVSAATLMTLQGSVTATLMSPQLEMVRPSTDSLCYHLVQRHHVVASVRVVAWLNLYT